MSVVPKLIPQLRVRVELDEIGQCNQDSPHGGPLPETEEQYKGNEVRRLIDPKDDPKTGARRTVPYSEYVQYEGNPDRHVILQFIVEQQCTCCHEWRDTEHSLGFVDFMDDDPWLMLVDYAPPRGSTYTPEQVASWPGYAREVAEELLTEARTDDA